MSFMPASPRKSAYSDHSHAASVPRLISVSIVAAPCLRLAHAALWNGHAAHSTTGVTSWSDSHWKLSNCSAGIIASSSAGTESSAATISRRRNGAVSSASSASAAPPRRPRAGPPPAQAPPPPQRRGPVRLARLGRGRRGGGRPGLTAGGVDGADGLRGGHAARVELAPGLLGRVVDGRADAVEL